MLGLRDSLKWRFMRGTIAVTSVSVVVMAALVGFISGNVLLTLLVSFCTAVACVLVVTIMIKVVNRRVIDPIGVLTHKALVLSGNDMELMAEAMRLDFRGNDELAHLERAFIDMLQRRQQAEMSSQRAVAMHNNTLESIKTGTMQMLDSVPFSCQVFNKHGMVIDCNNMCIEMFGFKSREDYIGTWNILLHSPPYQSDGSTSGDKWRQVFYHALAFGECEFEWLYMIDGEKVPVGMTLVKVVRASQEVIVSSAVDLRRIKRLEEEAHSGKHDFLTGLYNRRAFDVIVDEMFEKLRPHGGTFSAIIMDIDFFKKYNDSYGHNDGDTCLKTVAGALNQLSEQTGVTVARWGGEEFVIAMAGTNEVGAKIIAEKTCNAIRALGIPHRASDVAPQVTMSVGVTTGVVTDKSSVKAFVETADGALYESKQSGRNRWTFMAMNK